VDNWYQIIRQADAQDKLILLVDRAIGEHNGNKVLKELLEVLKTQAKRTVRIDISAMNGKIQKIETQINFKEWTMQFVGENEFDKLDEMKAYISGVMGKPKRIKSGYLYWGLTPTQYWLDLCSKERKISAITDFPRCWEDISSTINEFPELHSYVSLGRG
jgi:hypothetical protein